MNILKCLFGKRVSNRDVYCLIRKLGITIMATLEEIQTKVADIGTAVTTVDTNLDGVRALVQTLKDQVAASNPVTQADLDALDASLATIKEALGSVTTEVDGITA